MVRGGVRETTEPRANPSDEGPMCAIIATFEMSDSERVEDKGAWSTRSSHKRFDIGTCDHQPKLHVLLYCTWLHLQTAQSRPIRAAPAHH
jgi:hypothetical protein